MPSEANIETLLKKLRARDAVSAIEEAALREAAGAAEEYGPNETIVREGEGLDVSILLVAGLMCRYKDLRNGGRQISALHLSGDFVDLHGFTLKHLDHNILTLTRCRVVTFPHARLETVTEDCPHLTRLLWLSTNIDAAMHREWELSLGRRSAIARVAHLFSELLARLEVVSLAEGHSYPLQLTQSQIAECLGLTNVHVNRTLRELREQGLMEFRGGRVTIHHREKLARLAEFTPSYLYLTREPRYPEKLRQGHSASSDVTSIHLQ